MVLNMERPSVVSDGLALLLDGFNEIRSDRGRGPLGESDTAIIAECADDLGAAFEDDGLDENWGEIALSMMRGIGCFGREARLVRDMTDRFITSGRIGRDAKWCADEVDMLIVRRMWEAPDWNFMDFSERDETDDLVLDVCESVGVANMGNDWIDCLKAFIGEGVAIDDFLGDVRDALAHIASLGDIPEYGEARDEAVRLYMASRIKPAPGAALVVTKIAIALSTSEFGKRLGGEKSEEEWSRLLSAVSAGEKGRAMLGQECSGADMDWMERVIEGSGGTADVCAVAAWIEIKDEMRARAGSERALELLDCAEPMDLKEDGGVFTVWVDDAGDVADEFLGLWGGPIVAALSRILQSNVDIRVLDGAMRARVR